jgi:hypothetical protein
MKKEPGLCWNKGCTEKYSYEHRDVCKFRVKQVLRQMVLDQGMDIDDPEYDDQSPIFSMLQGASATSNFIYAPVQLAGGKVRAGIDSMASVSATSASTSGRSLIRNHQCVVHIYCP